MHHRLSAVALTAAAVFHPPFARAANPADRVVAPTVIVSASRFEERYQDRPVNTTVIDRAAIDSSTARTLPELLSQQPGLGGRDLYGNGGAYASIDMRGFGANATQNTLILLDGRPLNDIDMTDVQWSAVPLAQIDRIEILRGAGAVQYGAGASAGVIHIITRQPRGNDAEAVIGASAGSFDTYRVDATAAKGFGPLAIRAGASDYRSGGYRFNNSNSEQTGHADLRFTHDAGELRFTARVDRQDIRLPGARLVDFATGRDDLGRARRGAATPLDYATRDGNQVALDGIHRVGDLEFAAGLMYRDKRQTAYFDQNGFPDYRDTNLSVIGLTPRAKLSTPLAGRPNALVAGLDWYDWDYDLRLSDGPVHVATPSHVVLGRQRNRGVYVQDFLQLTPDTTLSAGFRRERFRLDLTDTFDPTAPGAGFDQSTAGRQSEWRNAWDLGVRQAFDGGTAVGARAGRSFRFATVDEIFETSASFVREFQFLRPQRATAYEAFVEQRFARASLRAALFRVDVTDEIRLDPYTSGIGNTNLPPLRRQGFELAAGANPLASLRLDAAYTFTSARFREGVLPGGGFSIASNVDLAGQTVPLVPRHRLSLGGTWSWTAATRLSVHQTLVSNARMENDEINGFMRIPGYGVTDVKLMHQAGDWRFTAAIANLFDSEYYQYAVRSQFVATRFNAYPLPGRTFSVAASYTFR